MDFRLAPGNCGVTRLGQLSALSDLSGNVTETVNLNGTIMIISEIHSRNLMPFSFGHDWFVQILIWCP